MPHGTRSLGTLWCRVLPPTTLLFWMGDLSVKDDPASFRYRVGASSQSTREALPLAPLKLPRPFCTQFRAQSRAPAPAGCPAIQLSPHSVRLEPWSDPAALPQQTAPASGPHQEHRWSPALLTEWLSFAGSSDPLLGFDYFATAAQGSSHKSPPLCYA